MKRNATRKLVLNREHIRTLTDLKLTAVHAGVIAISWPTDEMGECDITMCATITFSQRCH